MANTQRNSTRRRYSRTAEEIWHGRRWREYGGKPELWEDKEEYNALVDKLNALRSPGGYDELKREPNVPRRIKASTLANPERRVVAIYNEKARDELKANGHVHIFTATKKGQEFYIFIHTWELNGDLASYFEEGIDYTEGSIM